MVKISNLFLATAIFMTAVLGLYGTKPILKTSTKPKPKGVEMVLKRVQLRGICRGFDRSRESNPDGVRTPEIESRCCGVAIKKKP